MSKNSLRANFEHKDFNKHCNVLKFVSKTVRNCSSGIKDLYFVEKICTELLLRSIKHVFALL